MLLKLFRVFSGGYEADQQKINDMKCINIKFPKPIMSIMNTDNGFGRIYGATKKTGSAFSPVPVCVFRRDNKQLLWETTSKPDGSYLFRNIAEGLECFVVAFDPNEEYNAVIQDKVIAK
ncbi:hypothetical protein [Acinetobacter radioresistens]|uniref:hypothetical protein n=1 Tax=Acinetobacter radioresistens TaxID=40216 RepID=UPI00037729FF|nr:hypothetical protein [Acinetobacter radioresistens]